MNALGTSFAIALVSVLAAFGSGCSSDDSGSGTQTPADGDTCTAWCAQCLPTNSLCMTTCKAGKETQGGKCAASWDENLSCQMTNNCDKGVCKEKSDAYLQCVSPTDAGGSAGSGGGDGGAEAGGPDA